MKPLGSVSNWNDALDAAECLLGSGHLTAIATVTSDEFKMPYHAAHLEEFREPRRTLADLRAAAPDICEGTHIELWHFAERYPHAGDMIDGHTLVMVYRKR